MFLAADMLPSQHYHNNNIIGEPTRQIERIPSRRCEHSARVAHRVGTRQSRLPSIINFKKLLANESCFQNPLIYMLIAHIIEIDAHLYRHLRYRQRFFA
jgi:hypothetical protein